MQELSNPCMKKGDDILDLSSGILASTIGSLLPVSITKDESKEARVLQQVGHKAHRFGFFVVYYLSSTKSVLFIPFDWPKCLHSKVKIIGLNALAPACLS